MSFANNQVFGDDVTAVYSTEVYPLGTERLVLGSQTGVGDQVWVFVKTDADLVLGDVLVHKTTSANGNVSLQGTSAASPAAFYGVATGPVTAATAPYCWVVKRGVVTAKVASYTRDRGLILSTTAASFHTTNTATDAVCGYGLGAASGGLASVYVSAL